MECFSGFWYRRWDTAQVASFYWYTEEQDNAIKSDESIRENEERVFNPEDITEDSHSTSYSFERRFVETAFLDMTEETRAIHEDLRNVLKKKADKHRKYFEKLLQKSITKNEAKNSLEDSKMQAEMANEEKKESIPNQAENTHEDADEEKSSSSSQAKRQRKIGVYEMTQTVAKEENDTLTFKSVKLLKENYLKMLEKTTKSLSVSPKQPKKEENRLIDEGLLQPPPSGYCSSTASGASDDEKDKTWHQDKVMRCGSSDSAMGHSDEDIQEIQEIQPISSNWGEKIEEIDEEDILPYDRPIKSPYSPRGSVDHINVPSRTILEAKFVPFPIDRKMSDCTSELGGSSDVQLVSDSRRQSCFTDDGDEAPRYRYWRTPSVVVSDYSDDVVGLSLEDIEYIRNNRDEASSSTESSLHSSCSNLNYCGSTISGLDAEYVLKKPYRKSSACSTCSTLSDDEVDTLQPAKNREPSGWRKLRNIVQWTPFFQTYKKQRYPWVQLAGHQGNFKAGPDQGTILKKLCAKEEKCFKVLMNDVLRPYVPEYKGLVASDDGECSYIQLQDLLGDFMSPCVMDCKIGVRTYLEEELAKAKEKPKLRKDMYEKMCQIDASAPTEEEHRLKGVTKPRYMVWRETISSTATLGFRIEGIRKADGTSSKDFKTTRTKEEIIKAFTDFTEGFPHAIPKYIQRLKAIKATLETSNFFNTHEVIGSSLLFVHDKYNANVWLIDFAKTIMLPENIKITHSSKWKVGNHEDGYMIGVNNLISIFKTMLEQQPVTITPPLSLQDPPEIEEVLEQT